MEIKPDTGARVTQFLSNHPLFEGISQDSLALLAKNCRLVLAPKGTFIFFQSDPADAVYLVRRGAIAIRLDNPGGRELVINDMNPGDCFGELGVLTGQPRSTSAEAIVDSEVLLIPRATFQVLLQCEPPVAYRLLELTALRLQDSSRREEALAFHDAQQRLARLLLQLDTGAREKGYLTISQDELAQRTGLIRQTVATVLGGWRRRGWLLTGRGHIMLLNRREMNLLLQDPEHQNQGDSMS